jgi:hypothetical protein
MATSDSEGDLRVLLGDKVTLKETYVFCFETEPP